MGLPRGHRLITPYDAYVDTDSNPSPLIRPERRTASFTFETFALLEAANDFGRSPDGRIFYGVVVHLSCQRRHICDIHRILLLRNYYVVMLYKYIIPDIH